MEEDSFKFVILIFFYYFCFKPLKKNKNMKKTNLILPKNQRINNKIILKSFDLDFESFDDIIEFRYSENNIKEFKRIYIFHEH